MSSNIGNVRTGNMLALKNRIQDLEPLLEVGKHETFTVRELEYERDNFGPVMDFAVTRGAIEQVDTTYYQRECDTRRRRINVYLWNPDVYDELKAYRKNVDTLPCGHRVHLFNSREVPDDKCSCKQCAEKGDYPEFDQELVSELL